jgi:carboxymethylenebutenolidase
MRELGERRGSTFDDIDAAHDGSSGRIGVIGFCMGGAYALALAPNPGFAAP